MYMSKSFAPKLSRRTATPPALFVQKDEATSTNSVNTSHALLPVVAGLASGWPAASKHLPPRSPPVYVPATKVGPVQVVLVIASLTWPLDGVAPAASAVGKRRAMHVVMTRRRRIRCHSFGRRRRHEFRGVTVAGSKPREGNVRSTTLGLVLRAADRPFAQQS